MDYTPKLFKLLCIQNHDLSWIRNEKTSRKKALLLVEGGKNREETAREKMEEGSSKMTFPSL